MCRYVFVLRFCCLGLDARVSPNIVQTLCKPLCTQLLDISDVRHHAITNLSSVPPLRVLCWPQLDNSRLWLKMAVCPHELTAFVDKQVQKLCQAAPARIECQVLDCTARGCRCELRGAHFIYCNHCDPQCVELLLRTKELFRKFKEPRAESQHLRVVCFWSAHGTPPRSMPRCPSQVHKVTSNMLPKLNKTHIRNCRASNMMAQLNADIHPKSCTLFDLVRCMCELCASRLEPT